MSNSNSDFATIDPIAPEIYFVNRDVVKLCVDLLTKFTSNDSPDEYLKRELKNWFMWNDYDLYLTIEMFFGCLDRERSLQVVIKSFQTSHIARRLDVTPQNISELKVISFLVLFEAKRIEEDNMVHFLSDFSSKPAKRYFEFLLNECYKDSKIFKVLTQIYIGDFVEKFIMTNLLHARNVFRRVLGRFELCKPQPVYSPLVYPIFDYVPFQHRNKFVPKSHDCCQEAREELTKEFVAGTVPKSTFHEPLPSKSLAKELVKNRIKAENLLTAVKILGRRSSLYAVNQKSEKYFRIMDEIREERETSLKADSTSFKRIPLQKVLMEPSIPEKLNTATIMRQLETYRVRHMNETQELEKLMQGTFTADNQKRIEAAQLDEEQTKLATRWARMLDAKLTYQRSIAANRDVADRNREKANIVRSEMDLINEAIAYNKQLELDRVKLAAQAVYDADIEGGAQLAVEKVQAQKKLQAQEMKNEVKKLKEAGKLKEKEIQAIRMDRIQKIQADNSFVFRPQNQLLNPFRINKFDQMSEMSDAEMHIRLQKNMRDQAINLVLTKAKIRDDKEEKAYRLRSAKEELEWYRRLQLARKKQ